MTHRESIKEWLGSINIGGYDVVDWGAGTKQARRYTVGKEAEDYTAIDILPHVGADIITDICGPIDLTKKCDIAFCIEVLEHVKYPSKLLANIYKNILHGGVVYISAPFMFRIHSDQDLWRYTDQGIRFLLEEAGFQIIEIKPSVGTDGWLVTAKK